MHILVFGSHEIGYSAALELLGESFREEDGGYMPTAVGVHRSRSFRDSPFAGHERFR